MKRKKKKYWVGHSPYHGLYSLLHNIVVGKDLIHSVLFNIVSYSNIDTIQVYGTNVGLTNKETIHMAPMILPKYN